jgi:hypothetical protein
MIKEGYAQQPHFCIHGTNRRGEPVDTFRIQYGEITRAK